MVASARKRSGLSLLEVLVALAIFMLSIVVVSQMVNSAAQRGLRSQQLTRAALLCESKMEEIVAGAQPLQATSMAPLESGEAGWVYSVVIEPETWSSTTIDDHSVIGLNTVYVTVAWSGQPTMEKVEYTLSRLILDQRLRVPAPEPTTTSSSGSTVSPQR